MEEELSHQHSPIHELSSGAVVAEIDTSIYSLDGIFGACYKFTDNCYVFLSRDSDRGLIYAFFSPKDNNDNLRRVTGEFFNELIDQQLRRRLEAESADLRTLIVAQAFAEGNLLDENQDAGDYRNDPLEIRKRR